MKRAADVLSKLLEANTGAKGRAKGREYASVFREWRDLAGLSLAEHSRVYEIRHNNLFVEVDHNGWMQILLLRKARILERLARKWPELEIRDLKVRVNASAAVECAAAPDSRQSAGVPEAPEAPGAPEGEEVERIVSDVPQESLKKQLRRLFLSSLEARRRRP